MIQHWHRRFSFGFLLATLWLSAGGGAAATLQGSAGNSGVATSNGVMETASGPTLTGFEASSATLGWETPETPRLVPAGTAVMITASTLGAGPESGEEIWETPILSSLDVLTASTSPY
jgi:hypothetical protein